MTETLRIGPDGGGVGRRSCTRLIYSHIKPGTILFDGKTGEVKMSDFGLVCTATSLYRACQERNTNRSRTRSDNFDTCSDLWSLGAVLYQMSTGEIPARAPAMQNPQPPNLLNTDLPSELSDLIMGLMAAKPEERPGSAYLVATGSKYRRANRREG